VSKRQNDVAARRQKYAQALEAWSQHHPDDAYFQLMVAICLTQLGDHVTAQNFYRLSLAAAFRDRQWQFTGIMHGLVDTYLLANQPDSLPRLLAEIEAYKQDRKGTSLEALYAYSIASLLSSRDEEALGHVLNMLKKPKVKWTYAAGKAIQALIERDEPGFDQALEELLKAHRGMATVGGIRESPESFLCLQAMSLAWLASERGMAANAESEYLNKGYLQFLRGQALASKGPGSQND
jgi:tetratricopeptide (TPR) repeat protein